MFTWWVPTTYKALDSSLATFKTTFEAKLENKRPVDKRYYWLSRGKK